LRVERGEKGGGLTSPTTRELKAPREKREGGWITIANKKVQNFEL
jgi:hypothetical protein